ncbi:hypothetical protein [Micromonospora sp. U56]|uniref:hypothetical protein n=1 Tax=Micromonospora sp. U56 TaxID=2824900 RepID=UPI001B36494C|nr:hypothetical protein [Micromonospora sp. U56]
MVTAMTLAGCANEARQADPKKKPGAVATTEPAKPVEIQQRWWNWAAAEGTATNPVSDRSGVDCARNQPVDVWFFAGSFGETVRRKCSVPAGRPIVAPLVNVVASRKADCATFLRDATGSAKFDGKRLSGERMEGEKITYRGVDGNPITQTSALYEGTACGLWITIPAPVPGAHTLTIQGESGSFALRVDYTFNVTA